jgi:hypothetical protein
MKPGLGALEMELRVSFRQLVAASPVEAAILVLLCYKLDTCNTKDLHRQPL